mgnify:CR=1 FL=1
MLGVWGSGIEKVVNKETPSDEKPAESQEVTPAGAPEGPEAASPKQNKDSPSEQPTPAKTGDDQGQGEDAANSTASEAKDGETTATSGDTQSAPAVPGGTRPPIPIVMPQAKGESVLIKIFVLFLKLFAKMMPLIMVGIFAYYSYTSYFGPVPFVDKIWRKTAGTLGIEVAPPPAVEKKAVVSQMMDKAKAVVASNNKSVDFANALADDNVDMTELTALADAAEGGSDIQAQIAKLVPPGTMEAANGTAPTVGTDAVKATSPVATAQVRRQSTAVVKLSMLEEMSLVEVPTEIKPTRKFLAWVGKATIGGVMEGESPKAHVNGMNVDKGEIIEDELGISFEGVDPTGSLVIFKDRHGARIGKLY